MRRRTRTLWGLIGLPAVLLAACADPAPPSGAAGRPPAAAGPLVVYSGRGESLVGPLIERFRAATGQEVAVRYGETAELAATLLEEGEATPAHVFLSQDAGALGALAAAGRLRPLPAELLARVGPAFRSPGGEWVGLAGRVRVLVYNRDRVRPEELPQTLEEVAAPRFRGRFGLAPGNASFQAHLAAYEAVAGAAALDRLIAGLVANEPHRYPNNAAIVDAVLAGEIDFGLVNHYYLLRALAERPAAPGANFVQPAGPVAGFVNLTGVGLLREHPQGAAFVGYLLGAEAQRYFADETFEVPLAAGIGAAAPPGLPPLNAAAAPPVDFAAVAAALPDALARIGRSGLLE